MHHCRLMHIGRCADLPDAIGNRSSYAVLLLYIFLCFILRTCWFIFPSVPLFPDRCLPAVEQSAAERHVGTVADWFLEESFEDPSLHRSTGYPASLTHTHHKLEWSKILWKECSCIYCPTQFKAFLCTNSRPVEGSWSTTI